MPLAFIDMSEAVGSGPRLEIVESFERLAQLREPWEELAASEPTPFCSHAWFSVWWDAFGGDDRLFVALLWDHEALVAAYPLRMRDGRLSAMANVHSPLFRPLARDRQALRQISAAVLDRIGRHAQIAPLPADDDALSDLQQIAHESHTRTMRSQLHISPIVDTVGEFDAWRASSRPRWGAPLERFRRKMTRENAAELRMVETPEDLERELDRGFVVEASGWKGTAGTAIASSPETERFYRGIARAAAARGELRLSGITLDGELAAFDLTLLRNGRLYLLKTGFDERWRRLAPGLVLRLSVIERCFELGLLAHELLGDDSEWKRKFSTSSRAHIAVDVFGRGPRESASYAWRGAVRPALARARAVLKGG